MDAAENLEKEKEKEKEKEEEEEEKEEAVPDVAAQLLLSESEGALDVDLDEGICCVCMEVEKTHAFVPCGHKCACSRCAADIMTKGRSCPLCRERCDSALRVFE